MFFAGFVILIVLTRLPLVISGYGADGDSWRVAFAARTLWSTGTYAMSRPPGYPAHELLSSLLVGLGGSLLSNAATLVASLIAVAVLYSILKGRTQRPDMLTAAFAFAPLFWVNSATTMDYNWSLLMILLSIRAILQTRPISAGVWAGLAIGFRPTNAVLLVPLVLLLVADTSPSNPAMRLRKTGLLSFLLSCFAVTAVTFLPVFLTYGITGWIANLQSQFSAVSMQLSDVLLLFTYRAVYAIGPLACISALLIFLKNNAFATAWKNRDSIFVASLAALCVLTLFFALFPLEKSYLLAGLPFLLLVLDRMASPRAIALFSVLLISFGFVNPDIVEHRGARGAPGFNIHSGMVIEEWQARKELNEWRKSLASAAVPARTVIMTGVGPAFWFENSGVEVVQKSDIRSVNDVVVRRKGSPDIFYVPMIPREEAERLKQSGWGVLCDAKNREYIERTVGYRIEPIPLQDAP